MPFRGITEKQRGKDRFRTDESERCLRNDPLQVQRANYHLHKILFIAANSKHREAISRAWY